MKGFSGLNIPVFVLEVSSCSSPLFGSQLGSQGGDFPTSQMILSFPILNLGFFQLSSFASAEWVFIIFFPLLDVVSSLAVRDKLPVV